jgi:hypothetical protein
MSDPAQTDALAAEYVLGTLDFDERTQAQALLVIDPEFVAKVRLWERRLGELHLMVEPVEPEGKIWERIKAKMPPPPPPPEIKPAEPVEEPPTSAPSTSAPPTSEQPTSAPLASASPAAEAPAADAMSAATSESPPNFDPIAATLPAAPSIPSPAGLPPLLTPSVTPGVLPSSISSPASSVLPSSMARPLPSPSPDSDAPPSFLTVPLPPLPGQAAAPASAAAAVLSPSVPLPAPPIVREDRVPATRRGGTFWRMLAMLMTLVVVALGGLIAAWRFAPEHVPPILHPLELMRAAGITVGAGPPRKPAPPESQFDE